MIQQEIKFFWPLTEQISLDLDYSGCAKPVCKVGVVVPYTSAFDNSFDMGATIIAANLTFDVDTTVMKVKEKPSVLRRVLYNALGLKWEIK